MGLNDLEEAYKIELEVNPSPWKYETFLSSFEVGHKGLICKNDNQNDWIYYLFTNYPRSPYIKYFSKK